MTNDNAKCLRSTARAMYGTAIACVSIFDPNFSSPAKVAASVLCIVVLGIIMLWGAEKGWD